MKAEAVDQFMTKDQELVTTGFTTDAEECKPDSDNCFCKQTVNKTTGTKRFYVKRAAFGPEGGKLYNPWSVFGVKNDHLKQRDGRAAYSLKPVSQVSFYQYVEFLKTRNEAFLRSAERSAED